MKQSLFAAAALAIVASLAIAGCSGGAGQMLPNANPGNPSSDASSADTGETPAAPADDASPGSTRDSPTDTSPDDATPSAFPEAGGIANAAFGPAASKITLQPPSAALLSIGTVSILKVKVSERGYNGGFKQTSTCKKVVEIAPASLGKAGSFALQGRAGGTCAMTIRDTIGNAVVLKVSDTVAKIALAATSISPGSRSVTIALKSVNGKPPRKGLVTTVKTNLQSCGKGCSVVGPQSPPGKDTFSVSISDGSGGAGNVLAAGTVNGRVTIGKTASIAAALAKNVKTVSVTSVPGGTAGTAFGATALALSVQDADGNAVTGTYAHAVTISSSDVTGATTLGGGSGSANSQSYAGSSQRPNLSYSGLAISPVTLTASAAGAISGTRGSFAPVVSTIAYAGPTVSRNPEIDLYNTSGTGSSAQFTIAQAGWTPSPFNKNTAYAVCSSGNASSYTIAPASGSANVYTVTATNAAVAGTCNLMVTGGGGAGVTVKLTYTTSSLGVNGKTH